MDEQQDNLSAAPRSGAEPGGGRTGRPRRVLYMGLAYLCVGLGVLAADPAHYPIPAGSRMGGGPWFTTVE